MLSGRSGYSSGLPVLDLFGAYDDVQRLAQTRPDEISLDVELYQIVHADRGEAANSASHLIQMMGSARI
jgi:hypothetical protein